MKAVWSTVVGVICIASSLLLNGCTNQPGSEGTGLGFGDTAPPQSGDAAAGAAIFAANGCNTCHGEDGSGGFGPSLRSVPVETLAAKLQDPGVGHTGGLFPDLTADDLALLAAFLGTGDGPTAPSGPLHTVDMNNTGILHAQGFDDPTANCAACHGRDLNGSPPAPSCFTCHGPLWSGGGPPPSHTDVLSNGDVTGAHLPGRDNPTANCTACHQNDLMGRFRVPSCFSCHGSRWDGPPDVPPTHTVVEDGVRHAVGLESPADNCASCHGADLTGTSLIPSCYSCHGSLWTGGGAPPSHTDTLINGSIAGAHPPGRDAPASNCASCHQPDLFGTRLIPACWRCHGSIWDGLPDYPPTHTKVEDGFHHDPDLESPVGRCDACHGSDLTGTPLIPSCFSCHGDKWNDDDDDR